MNEKSGVIIIGIYWASTESYHKISLIFLSLSVAGRMVCLPPLAASPHTHKHLFLRHSTDQCTHNPEYQILSAS